MQTSPFQLKKLRPAVNIIPLIDVLTILIFFFLTSMQFQRSPALEIVPPQIDSAEGRMENESLVIAIDAAGKLYADGQEISLQNLTNLLSQSQNCDVLLFADENSPLKSTTTILDLCRKLNCARVHLQAR